MAVSSELSYEVVPGWEQLPPQFHHRDVSGVGVDAHDRVYVLTRGEPRVLVYEPDGTYVTSWAEGMFTDRTHGLRIGPDGSVYCVDDGDHTVRKFTSAGKLVMMLGTVGQASDTGYDGSTIASIKRGGPPFNRPTNISIAPSGELYVCDGYGNARVHRFTAGGKLIQSWGEPGSGPGQFNLPHSIWCLLDGRVMVADRENDRIQFFSPAGQFLSEWTHVQRPTDVTVDRNGLVYVSELPWRPGQASFRLGPMNEHRQARVSVLDLDGKILARWGGADGAAPGNFWAPHTICADSHGSIYVGEVAWSFSGLGKAGITPPGCHTLQKFVRKQRT